MQGKKRILLIGPFNEYGGREIEASFIYDALKDSYNITIASTEILSNNNMIFKLSRSKMIFSKIKRIGIKFRIIRFFFGDKVWFRLNNGVKFISYEDLIFESDLVFILAQIISPNILKIIRIAQNKQKKIIFRTTGTNPVLNFNRFNSNKLDLFNNVDIYLHHSKDNYNRLNKTFAHSFEIIDQAVFLEQIINNPKPIHEIKNFYCTSRIDANKNLELVVRAFNQLKNLNLNLHIYGDGDNLDFVKSISNSDKIFFYGHLDNHELLKRISNHDCLIISSFEESGPYTALEAMVNAKIILSTRVGAMNERLEEAPYCWEFNPNSEDSLVSRILDLRKYKEEKLALIQGYMINRYKNNYSSEEIKNKYIAVVEKVLNTKVS